MNQAKRICAIAIVVIMLLGMTVMPAFGSNTDNVNLEVGFMFDNIFNNGNASVVDSFNSGTWISSNGISVTENGRGVANPALRFNVSGNEAVGFISIPLEAGETYNVRVLARNAESGARIGPMRPREDDDAQTNTNKLSFQYDSASEDAAGFTGDRFNMYITSTDWEWVEMTFTTPADMQPTWAGSPILVFAMRSSTAWIAEVIIENVATGENVFNNGNSMAGEAVLDAVWSDVGSIVSSTEGTATPSQAVRMEAGGSGEISIPLISDRIYDVWVLARSENANFTDMPNSIFIGNHGVFLATINVTNTEWQWNHATFTMPSDDWSPSVVLNALDSTMYVEAIIIRDQNPGPRQATLTVNPNVTHQTIEGFGFFGAMNVWWSGPDPNTYFNAEWIDTVLLDLGLTMWRNEPFPFIDPRSDRPEDAMITEWPEIQDTNWPIQRPMVEALHNRAMELGIPLRIILTAWTPPPQWKYPQTAKGGTLLPQYYEAYGYWWVEVLEMYREIGIEVYAISLQNEPAFEQTYNSMQIWADEYVEMIKVAVPIINAAFPDVLIFGAEGMLSDEHNTWGDTRVMYHQAIVNDPVAFALMDRFAVHGYLDGVSALGIEHHRRYWELERELTGDTPNWMTETSGYGHHWLDAENGTLGALSLAIAMQSALIYGDLAAWVYWQGHTSGTPSLEMLWGSAPTTNIYYRKKFAVSRHFFHFIRPDAVRIGTTVTGPETDEDLLISAYRNKTRLTSTGEIDDQHYVVTLVNTSEFDHTVNINGLGNLNYEMFITTGEAGVNAISLGVVGSNDIFIPAQSVVTLVQTDAQPDSITVLLNGRRLVFDVPPQIIDDRTMVPMRVIFEALGFDVEWDNNEQLITAVGTDVHRTSMTLQIGNDIMELETIYLWIGMPADEPRPDVFSSSIDVTLDVPPIIVNDRTLVPLRAIAETTGATVDWNQDTQTVIIVIN